METNKGWFELSFEEKLLKAHYAVLFPETIDKNISDFLSMLIQGLLNIPKEELDEFFKYRPQE